MEGEEKPQLGRRVVVYGGGNTAMDAARTAKRLRRRAGDVDGLDGTGSDGAHAGSRPGAIWGVRV